MKKNHINKKDLSDILLSHFPIIRTKTSAEDIVEMLISTIIGSVSRGCEVRISGLGIFERKKMKTRIARNPRTGEKISVPEHWKAKFKPSKGFIEMVKGEKI